MILNFRHRCLQNGDFSPAQCWPKVGLCWCVTISGIKLQPTMRKMMKFQPKVCEVTYDPTGIREQRKKEAEILPEQSSFKK